MSFVGGERGTWMFVPAMAILAKDGPRRLSASYSGTTGGLSRHNPH